MSLIQFIVPTFTTYIKITGDQFRTNWSRRRTSLLVLESIYVCVTEMKDVHSCWMVFHLLSDSVNWNKNVQLWFNFRLHLITMKKLILAISVSKEYIQNDLDIKNVSTSMHQLPNEFNINTLKHDFQHDFLIDMVKIGWLSINKQCCFSFPKHNSNWEVAMRIIFMCFCGSDA